MEYIEHHLASQKLECKYKVSSDEETTFESAYELVMQDDPTDSGSLDKVCQTSDIQANIKKRALATFNSRQTTSPNCGSSLTSTMMY